MQVEESNKSLNFQHIPVLADEIINSMQHIPSDLIEGGSILDGTIGGGGHASLILEKFSSINLIGLDHDPEARSASKLKLNKFSSRIKIIDSNFSNYEPNQKKALGIVECENEVKAKSARIAMLFSRTNTLLSLPMILTMVAAQNLY